MNIIYIWMYVIMAIWAIGITCSFVLLKQYVINHDIKPCPWMDERAVEKEQPCLKVCPVYRKGICYRWHRCFKAEVVIKKNENLEKE